MVNRRLISISVAVLAFLPLWPVFASPEKSLAAPETLSVGIYDGEISLLVLVAENQGFYAKNGLDVKISGFEAGVNSFTRLLAGDLDVASPADYVFVRRSLLDDTPRILASISASDLVEVLARKDKGIRQPSDLKGKRIGTTLGTISEAFLRTFLLLRYISPDDVTMIDLPPSQIVAALSRGDIDAAVTWDSFAYEIKKQIGKNMLSWPAQDYQDAFILLATRKDVIETKPKAIELFLKSLVEAEEFVRTHEEEAKAIIYGRWKREPAYVDHIWGRIRFSVSLDQSLIKAMEANARALRRRAGDGAPIPNYLDFMYFRGLDTVNPKAITIFR
jgi:ABC-type nitrate/sulfonate/bicarbonate transport system substrate-binding protein